MLWWDTTSEFSAQSPDALRKLMSDLLTSFDGGGLFNSKYVSAENAPGSLAAELAENSYDVIVFDSTNFGAFSFDQADYDALTAFYETHSNVLLDGVLWIRSANLNATTNYPGINGSSGDLTANQVFQLASRGGGVLIGTDHNCCQTEANILIAAMIPGAGFSGSTFPSLDGQFNGDDLLNAVAVVSPSDLFAHWSSVPSEGIAPTGNFTDVFGNAVTLYSQVDVADDIGGPKFSYISTSFEPGGGIIEFDCNDNGILDSIDIADGTSPDENENGIPDECEGPTVHGPFEVLGWPEAILLSNDQDLAYIARRENGFDIDDVTDRNLPSTRSNFTPTAGQCPDGFFADELTLLELVEEVIVLVAGGVCGAVGVDVTDPDNPSFVDRAEVPMGLVEEVVVLVTETETFLLAASYWQGLQIFSVDGECDPSSCAVTPRGSIGADDDAWGAALAIWLEVFFPEEGPPQVLAYVAETNGLRIVDVSDPDNLVLLGSYDTNPTGMPLAEQDDVPQDVVVFRNPDNGKVIAYVPLWIGGFLVLDVTDPTNLVFVQLIPASPGSAFFKVEISDQGNRIYVTEGLYGLAVFIQDPETGMLDPMPETRFPIGIGDERCGVYVDDVVAELCWAWAVNEVAVVNGQAVDELVAVSYGVFVAPFDGGYQLISQSPVSEAGLELELLGATPVPEPHALMLQGVGVLALAGLGRLRRRGLQRRARRELER